MLFVGFHDKIFKLFLIKNVFWIQIFIIKKCYCKIRLLAQNKTSFYWWFSQQKSITIMIYKHSYEHLNNGY